MFLFNDDLNVLRVEKKHNSFFFTNLVWNLSKIKLVEINLGSRPNPFQTLWKSTTHNSSHLINYRCNIESQLLKGVRLERGETSVGKTLLPLGTKVKLFLPYWLVPCITDTVVPPPSTPKPLKSWLLRLRTVQ